MKLMILLFLCTLSATIFSQEIIFEKEFQFDYLLLRSRSGIIEDESKNLLIFLSRNKMLFSDSTDLPYDTCYFFILTPNFEIVKNKVFLNIPTAVNNLVQIDESILLYGLSHRSLNQTVGERKCWLNVWQLDNELKVLKNNVDPDYFNDIKTNTFYNSTSFLNKRIMKVDKNGNLNILKSYMNVNGIVGWHTKLLTFNKSGNIIINDIDSLSYQNGNEAYCLDFFENREGKYYFLKEFTHTDIDTSLGYKKLFLLETDDEFNKINEVQLDSNRYFPFMMLPHNNHITFFSNKALGRTDYSGNLEVIPMPDFQYFSPSVMKQTSDGGIILAGSLKSDIIDKSNYYNELFIIKFDKDLRLQWKKGSRKAFVNINTYNDFIETSDHNLVFTSNVDNTFIIQVIKDPALSLKDNESSEPVLIFPNPAHNQFNLSLPEDALVEYYVVYNAVGEKVADGGELNAGSLDVSALPAGVYYIKCMTSQGMINQKFVVRR